jgi:hypothetical protein
MTNTITIDSNVYQHAENYAKMHNLSVKELIESALKMMMGSYVNPATEHKKEASWHHYKVSDEVMALTFKHRMDIPEDYKNEYYKAINERCQ